MCTVHLISVDMLRDDFLRQNRPGCFLLNVINQRSGARGRHIINEYIRLCREPFEVGAQSMQAGDFAAIIRTAGGPKEQMAPFLLQAGKSFACAVEQLPVRIDQRQIHIDKSICLT